MTLKTQEERLQALESRVSMQAAQIEILERARLSWESRLRAIEHYLGLEARSAAPGRPESPDGSSDPAGEGAPT